MSDPKARLILAAEDQAQAAFRQVDGRLAALERNAGQASKRVASGFNDFGRAVLSVRNVLAGFGVVLSAQALGRWAAEALQSTRVTKEQRIVLDEADFVVLTGLLVHDLGEEAVHFRDFSSDNVLSHSEVRDTGRYSAGFGEGYRATLRQADSAIGALLKQVADRRAAHPDENWLVVVASSHGNQVTEAKVDGQPVVVGLHDGHRGVVVLDAGPRHGAPALARRCRAEVEGLAVEPAVGWSAGCRAAVAASAAAWAAANRACTTRRCSGVRSRRCPGSSPRRSRPSWCTCRWDRPRSTSWA